MSLPPLPGPQGIPNTIYRWLGLLKSSFDDLKTASDSNAETLAGTVEDVAALNAAAQEVEEERTEIIKVAWMPKGTTPDGADVEVTLWSDTVTVEPGDLFLPLSLSDGDLETHGTTAGSNTYLRLYGNGVLLATFAQGYDISGADAPTYTYPDAPPLTLTNSGPTLFEMKLEWVDNGPARRETSIFTNGPIFIIRE